MAVLETKIFYSWDELSNFIDSKFTYFNNFSFRGHAESEWKLESTLSRAIKRKKKKENFNNLVKQHFDNFKKNLRGRSRYNLTDLSENELLAIGQHYGLYTPLLDLSDSPYVGLFFAQQGDSESGERCLWAFSNEIVKDFKQQKDVFSDKVELVSPITNHNARLVSQQGLFLKLPIELSFEEVIEKTVPKNDGVDAYKLIFNDNIRNDSLAALNNMNINNLTLFPDLIGASSHSNYVFDIEEHLTKRRNEIWKESKE